MLSKNLAEYLEDNAIGTVGTDMFISTMPDSTDNCIMIKDTGGVEPDHYLPIIQPTIQVLVRNSDYTNGMTKINAIKDLLHQKLDDCILEIGGVDVMTCFAMQEPTHLGMDDNERHMFSCNFVFKIRK